MSQVNAHIGIAESEIRERQLDQARGFAAAKGWAIRKDAVFVDEGISGAEFEPRPGIVALLAAVGVSAGCGSRYTANRGQTPLRAADAKRCP